MLFFFKDWRRALWHANDLAKITGRRMWVTKCCETHWKIMPVSEKFSR